MQVCSVVGARPQFVKAAVVSRALSRVGIDERMVHTGQHYDPAMSAVFFDELGISEPHVNLDVGSGSHAVQTGDIMVRFEEYLQREGLPDWVLVYGDTNSTIAAAVVAAKLHVRVAHVEAGLRSFNRCMPEEINRVVTDHLSNLCFCPTPTAVENLRNEGMTRGVHLTGDVMYDATLQYASEAAVRRPLSDLTAFGEKGYYLATVHRAENTDDPERLAAIVEGFGRLDAPVILPLHPRTRTRIETDAFESNVHVWEPVGYLSMLTLVQHARAVLTDSGGLQKEAVWLGTPCITLRDETEWVETLEGGWNQLVGADADALLEAARHRPTVPPPSPGEPGASDRIAAILLQQQDVHA